MESQVGIRLWRGLSAGLRISYFYPVGNRESPNIFEQDSDIKSQNLRVGMNLRRYLV